MKITGSKFKKFSGFKKYAKLLAERSFFTILTLFIIAAIAGVFVYYQYVILAQMADPKITLSQIRFDEESFFRVLNVWKEKEDRIQSLESKQYKNPFQTNN